MDFYRNVRNGRNGFGASSRPAVLYLSLIHI